MEAKALQVNNSPNPRSADLAQVLNWWDRADRPQVRAVLIMMLVLLYAASYAPHWQISPDSALYLSMGRSLAEGEGLNLPPQGSIRVLSGFPILLALIYRIAGENFPLMNAVMMLTSGLFIIGCYFTFRNFTGSSSALLITFLVGASHLTMRYSGRLLADLPFAATTMLTLLLLSQLWHPCVPRRWPLWAVGVLASIAASMLLRPTGIGVLAGALTILWLGPGQFSRRQRFTVSLIWLLPISLVTLSTVLLLDAGSSEGYFQRFILHLSPKTLVLRWAYFTAFQLPATLGEAIHNFTMREVLDYLAVIYLLLGMATLWKGRQRTLVLFTLIQLGGICVLAPNRRYVIYFLPLLLYFALVGLLQLYVPLLSKISSRIKAEILVPVIWIVIFLSAATVRNLQLVKLAQSNDYYATLKDGRYKDYHTLAGWLRQQQHDSVLTFVPEPIVLGYLARKPVDSPFPGRSPADPAKELFRKLSGAHTCYVFATDEEPEIKEAILQLLQDGKIIAEPQEEPRLIWGELWLVHPQPAENVHAHGRTRCQPVSPAIARRSRTPASELDRPALAQK